MANNLFVSYDLYNPGQNYEAVAKAITTVGSAIKIQKSVWYVSSSLAAEKAAECIWAAMDQNDSLIVVDASHNDAYWYGLSNDAAKFMQTNWYRHAA